MFAGCHDGGMDFETAEVKASGGVVWRRTEDGEGVELVVVHRPRYDDWSLPKGKLDPGESWEQAALREVDEEVGLALPARRRAPARLLHRPQGPRQGRPLLADAAAGRARGLHAERRGGRDALGGSRDRGGLLSYPHDVELVRAAHGAAVNRDRFPGLAGSWVRLDGPAGTQMVDTAIEAMADFMRSGDNANHGGVFAAAHATDACVERARAAVARLLGRRAGGRRLRPVDDRDDDAALGGGRAHARAGRRGRRHAPGPRRERAAVGDRGRARGRDRPLGGARPRDAGAARVRRSRPCSPTARAGSR